MIKETTLKVHAQMLSKRTSFETKVTKRRQESSWKWLKSINFWLFYKYFVVYLYKTENDNKEQIFATFLDTLRLSLYWTLLYHNLYQDTKLYFELLRLNFSLSYKICIVDTKIKRLRDSQSRKAVQEENSFLV